MIFNIGINYIRAIRLLLRFIPIDITLITAFPYRNIHCIDICTLFNAHNLNSKSTSTHRLRNDLMASGPLGSTLSFLMLRPGASLEDKIEDLTSYCIESIPVFNFYGNTKAAIIPLDDLIHETPAFSMINSIPCS